MKNIVAAALMLLIASSANGEIHVQSKLTAQPNFPSGIFGCGEDIVQVAVDLFSDNPAEVIYGIDAEFQGPMGQVNPFGLQVVLLDNIGALGSEAVVKYCDSHFLFFSNQFAERPTGVEESPTSLAAVLTDLPSATNSDGTLIELAVIAHPLQPAKVRYRFSVDVRDRAGAMIRTEQLAGFVYPVPEPASIYLIVCVYLGITAIKRRTNVR